MMESIRPAVGGIRSALLVGILLGFLTPTAWAADNQATGDINGIAGDLTDSNTFSIMSSTLALVKAAFLTDGTQLTSGASVPAGTRVRFVIWIDNTTAVPVPNVNVQDVLDSEFAYQTGTIKVDNSLATGATAAAIYAAVNATSAITDTVSGADVAGVAGTTISAGLAAGNAQLDLAASAVWAIQLEVVVQ